MERIKVNLLSDKVIAMYDYELTKIKIRDFFEKYMSA